MSQFVIAVLLLTPSLFSALKINSPSDPEKACSGIPGWFQGQEVYTKAVQEFESGLFVEIGAYLGQSSCYMSHLLQSMNKNITFHVMDYWGPIEDYKWAPEKDLAEVRTHDGSYKATFEHYMENTGSLPAITKIIHGSDRDQTNVDQYADDSVSFLYLDTSHDYEGTSLELSLWWPKVRAGGMFCGDDYLYRRGERKAVDEFFKKIKENVQDRGNNQFCVQKKKD